MNRNKMEKMFYAAMEAGERGARINLQLGEPYLITTFFLITREGKIEMVAWERDEHPRDAIEDIKRIVREQFDTVGMVVIAETNVTTPHDRVMGIPAVEAHDGVLIYGWLPGDRNNAPVESVRAFVRQDATLTATNMYLPESVMAWVQEALQ